MGSGDRHEEMPGELIYEYQPQVVKVVEYGLSADDLFSGQTPPPEGARIDLYLEGPVSGSRLQGRVNGVDYIRFRADGRAELHIHGEITTNGGKKLSLEAGGVAIPDEPPVFQLREHVALTTNHPELAWVNQLEIWATGKVDVSSGHVHVRAYSQ